MKITTKIVLDMNTGAVTEHLFYDYSGPVEECKGAGTSKDQLDLQNKLQQQQLDQQKAIRDQIMGGIGKYLSGGVGFDPATMAAMTSQFLNQNTANFNQAGQQVMSSLAARGAGGGQLPVGGDFVRGIASLDAARANSQSQGILGLNITNAQQALNNQFNAASVAAGQSAQLGNNIGVFGQGANNALNQYVSASNQGFGAAFSKGLGNALGAGLGDLATGGIGASLGGVGKFLGQAPVSVNPGSGSVIPQYNPVPVPNPFGR